MRTVISPPPVTRSTPATQIGLARMVPEDRHRVAGVATLTTEYALIAAERIDRVAAALDGAVLILLPGATDGAHTVSVKPPAASTGTPSSCCWGSCSSSPCCSRAAGRHHWAANRAARVNTLEAPRMSCAISFSGTGTWQSGPPRDGRPADVAQPTEHRVPG